MIIIYRNFFPQILKIFFVKNVTFSDIFFLQNKQHFSGLIYSFLYLPMLFLFYWFWNKRKSIEVPFWHFYHVLRSVAFFRFSKIDKIYRFFSVCEVNAKFFYFENWGKSGKWRKSVLDQTAVFSDFCDFCLNSSNPAHQIFSILT
jgi:hypothetical protein